MFTRITQRTRKVNVFYMFSQVAFILVYFTTQGATPGSRCIFCNVLVKICTWKQKYTLIIHPSMEFRNMHIQKVPGSKHLITVFATVWKRTRKMDIFNVFSQIALVIAFFATNGTFETLCSIIAWHNILVQSKVTWKQSKIRPIYWRCLQTLLCIYNMFLVENISLQNWHWWRKVLGKWMFSTCFLRLLLSFETLPHSLHINALGPPSWYLSM